ncbi:toll-like receptor Tollo [Eurytemora carolleeae]|uniref:toll-like receptor Tollo n=1 Tax=Eurytemora carolleeae TaxID=1294199 RepID=UPI000C78DF69|nr:toll-like receptor Tollo [Eurytemora carolleeae]|eukprot:XP_023345104.1 toll-like receptor Tollo [Eurytemora affinis]
MVEHGLYRRILRVTFVVLTIILILTASSLYVFRNRLPGWVSGHCSTKFHREVCISCSSADQLFLQQAFLPNLKKCDIKFRVGVSPPSYSSASKLVLLVSQVYLETEWSKVRSVHLSSSPIIVLLEEITSLQLAQVPEFNILLGTSLVLRWAESGFWPKFLFYLTDQEQIEGILGKETGYDCVGQTSDGSTSTRSTAEGSGSPRFMENFSPRSDKLIQRGTKEGMTGRRREGRKDEDWRRKEGGQEEEGVMLRNVF